MSGSKIQHLNGSIGEIHGYIEALANGEIGIQAPGKVTGVGPDYITYDNVNDMIKVYDSKYSSKGRYPKTAKGFGSKSWLEMIQKEINNIKDPEIRAKAEKAFNANRIKWEIFKWPSKDKKNNNDKSGGNGSGGGNSKDERSTPNYKYQQEGFPTTYMVDDGGNIYDKNGNIIGYYDFEKKVSYSKTPLMIIPLVTSPSGGANFNFNIRFPVLRPVFLY